MTIPFFVLVIEKAEGSYSGYSPSFAGVSASGASREDVERSVLGQIDAHVKELNRRHTTGSHRLELSTKPIQEKISCLEIIGEGERWARPCIAAARKEVLCWQHWKARYGHHSSGPAGSTPCQLCGERDPVTLSKWDAPCEFKATHSDWPDVLNAKQQEALAAKRIAAEDNRRRKRIESLPIQCAAMRTQGPKGVRCSNRAQRDGLCTNHWKIRK